MKSTIWSGTFWIAAGQGLDLDAVKKAVAAAVAESLAGLDADVTLTVKEAAG